MTEQKPQNTETSVSAAETSLKGFRSVASIEKEGSLEQMQANFARMRDELKALKQVTLAGGLSAAPEFNVFKLLGLSRAEVRTHSAMLAHLLRPGEVHGQQFLFLESFLEYCHCKEPTFPLPSGELESSHWSVFTEYVTPSEGRLDIVVRSLDLGYIFVIENKVDAWEQTDQVKRYARWLENQQQDYPVQSLIFLTLRGGSAYSGQGIRYLPLSYHEDIYAWLTGILDRIQAPNVRTVVAQYVELVRNL